MRRIAPFVFALLVGAALGWLARGPRPPVRPVEVPAGVQFLGARNADPLSGRYTPFHINDRGSKARAHAADVDEARVYILYIRHGDGSETVIHATRD